MALDSIIIAQVNANTLALNKINEDARKTSELPILPTLDPTDLIRIEKAGVSYKTVASQFLPPNSEFLEYIYNKQNDLSPDGTGVMYPTVDAVIEGLSGFLKTDKIDDKTLKQTGLYRPDIDVSVLSITPANTLNITAVNNVLFINEILPDSPTNVLDDYLKDFGDVLFVANSTNTPLASGARGIFYVGLDKLGNAVYKTSKIYDQDVCYLARILVANTGGTYTVVSFKYFPDLANNKINNHDRFVMYSGYIVPSTALSISFGNRGVTFGKNSINYSANKFDPNFLSLADSVNPAPMQFLFALPNITSLAVDIARSTVMNPTQWFTSAGALGGTAVAGANYQVYRLLVSVTGTLIIQTKASVSNAPQAGVNAIFANRDDALAGLTSTIWPDILPLGDAIALGTFYLRAGTAVNGSQLNDPNDFYFRPYIATSSSSSVGVTVHDLLSGKNDNPAFLHVASTDITNWNAKIGGAGTNKIAKFTGAGIIGDSNIYDDGTTVMIYTTTPTSARLTINGGINSNGGAPTKLDLTGSLNGLPTTYGVRNRAQIQFDSNVAVYYNKTEANTTTGSTWTLPNLYHYSASQGVIGAGTTITKQYGFHVDANMVSGDANYAFRSDLPAGVNNWGLFIGGTARNYIQGQLAIGTNTMLGSSILTTVSDGIVIAMRNITNGTSPAPVSRRLSWYTTAPTECAYIDVPDARASVNGVAMIFATKDNAGTLATRMVIANGGNIGIGTDNPLQSKLVIEGISNILTLKGSDSGQTVYQTWYNPSAVRRGYFGFATGSSPVISLVNEEPSGHIVLSPTASGNIGAGVGNPSASVHIRASTATASALRINIGVAPTTPNDGDIWIENNGNTGLKIRIGGVTKTISLV